MRGECIAVLSFFFFAGLLHHTSCLQSTKNLVGILLYLILHAHTHTYSIMGHYLFNNNGNHITQAFQHHAFFSPQYVIEIPPSQMVQFQILLFKVTEYLMI